MNVQQRIHRSMAFTLLELLVTMAIVLIMFVVVLSPSNHRHTDHRRSKCINNLKNVGLAFRIFATDNGDQFPFEISSTIGGSRELHANGDPFAAFQVLSNELSTPRIVICPNDTRREATNWTNFSNQNVSYFLNTNAVESNPSAFLAGDRNIEHNGKRISTGRFVVPAGTSIRFDKRIHELQGNVCMADGSVQQFSNARIVAQTNHTGYVLAVP